VLVDGDIISSPVESNSGALNPLPWSTNFLSTEKIIDAGATHIISFATSSNVPVTLLIVVLIMTGQNNATSVPKCVLDNESRELDIINQLLAGQNFGNTYVNRTSQNRIERPPTGEEDFRRLEYKLGDKSKCHNHTN
jgi:hypothetical protein